MSWRKDETPSKGSHVRYLFISSIRVSEPFMHHERTGLRSVGHIGNELTAEKFDASVLRRLDLCRRLRPHVEICQVRSRSSLCVHL